jgi:hypothetical protein
MERFDIPNRVTGSIPGRVVTKMVGVVFFFAACNCYQLIYSAVQFTEETRSGWSATAFHHSESGHMMFPVSPVRFRVEPWVCLVSSFLWFVGGMFDKPRYFNGNHRRKRLVADGPHLLSIE